MSSTEARLMTLQEAASMGPKDTAVVEYRNPIDKPFGNLTRFPETYGKTWRCWTKKPTKKQAKEAAWD